MTDRLDPDTLARLRDLAERRMWRSAAVPAADLLALLDGYAPDAAAEVERLTVAYEAATRLLSTATTDRDQARDAADRLQGALDACRDAATDLALTWEAERDAALARIDAALALHQPGEQYVEPNGGATLTRCDECEYDYPCATVRALADAGDDAPTTTTED